MTKEPGKKSRAFIFCVAFFLLTAFTWPWEQGQTQKGAPSGKSAQTGKNPSVGSSASKSGRQSKANEEFAASNGGEKKDEQIQALENQINGILKMNEVVKAQNQNQAAEIQRIVEQARIHKQILQSLAAAQNKPAYRPDDAAALLQQEKIRLIQEQTLRSLNAIQNFKPALAPVLANPQVVQDIQRVRAMQQAQESLRVVEQTKNSRG